MTDLSLVTNDEIFQELIKRHTGDRRSLCIVSCVPEDGKPDMSSFRTVFVAQNLALLRQSMLRASAALERQ